MEKINNGQVFILVGLTIFLVGFIIYRAVKYDGQIVEKIEIEETDSGDDTDNSDDNSEYQEQDLETLTPAQLMMYKRSLDMCTRKDITLTSELANRCMIVTGKLKQYGYAYNPTTKQIRKM